MLLPPELLGDANGLLTTVREGLRLVAPLVGAGLFVVAGGGTVAAIDAGTFIAAAAATLVLHIREPVPERVDQKFFTEMIAGFRHVLGTTVLRRMSISLAVALFVIGFGETVVFAVVATGLHRPPSFIGVLLAVQGVGALAGGPSAAPVMRRIGEPLLVLVGLLLAGLASITWVSSDAVLVLAGCMIFGLALPWIVVGAMTLLQRRTPAAVQGRAFSAFDLFLSVPQTISIGLGALLIAVIGYRTEVVVMAAVTAASALILLPSARDRVSADPAAVPEERETAAA